MPKVLTRIQSKRLPGWKMPPHTKACVRPLALSNPFKIEPGVSRQDVIDLFRHWATEALTAPVDDIDYRQLKFRVAFQELQINEITQLGCWCKESESCHVDIIIELFKERHG